MGKSAIFADLPNCSATAMKFLAVRIQLSRTRPSRPRPEPAMIQGRLDIQQAEAESNDVLQSTLQPLPDAFSGAATRSATEASSEE